MSNIQKLIKIGAICLAVFIILNILGVILLGISLFANIDFFGNNNKSINESYTNVESIVIDISSSSVRIEEGDEFRVEASNMKKSFSSELKNNTLRLTEKSNWFWNKNSNGEIIIYVPSYDELNKLEIDSGAGKVFINALYAYELDIDMGAGNLSISNSKFDNTKIDGGAGNIEISSSILNDLDIDAGVGSIEINSVISGDSNIDCGVGEIDITLLGDSSDYSIRSEKGIGSITIEGIEQKNDTVYGNGANKLEIDGGIGSINIDFKPIESGQ